MFVRKSDNKKLQLVKAIDKQTAVFTDGRKEYLLTMDEVEVAKELSKRNVKGMK